METLWIVGVVALVLTAWFYAKSKTWADKGRFTLFLLAIASAVGCFCLITRYWAMDGLNEEGKNFGLAQLQIVPWFFVQYAAIGLIAIFLCAWRKGGFSNLKKFDGGVIVNVIFGVLGVMVSVLLGVLLGIIEEFKQ